MVMVPTDDWKAFIANTLAQVRSGEIPMSRIDDAVTPHPAREAARRACSTKPKPSRATPRASVGTARRTATWPARPCASRWCC